MLRPALIFCGFTILLASCGPSPAQKALLKTQTDITAAQKDLARDVASSLNAQPPAAYDPENPGPKPTLEPSVLSDKTSQRDNSTTRRYIVQYGYWAAKCTAVKKQAEPVEGWCDLIPILAKQPTNSNVLLPPQNRATVSLFKEKPAKVIVRTQPRVRGSRLSFDCGFAKWFGPEEYDRLKFFYDKDAAKFVTSMSRNDCELSYTPKGASDPEVIAIPSHGFKEAHKFAKAFVRRPKLN